MLLAYFLIAFSVLTPSILKQNLAVLAQAAPSPPCAHPMPNVSVQVRVQGRFKTIFDGRVVSQGHIVKPESGYDYCCDGNNEEHPHPGWPTVTSALDTAAHVHHFTWDG